MSRRELILTVISAGQLTIDFKIVTQTHRVNDFGKDGIQHFTAKNGWRLFSASYPDVDFVGRTFMVRGSDLSKDNVVLTSSTNDFQSILDAVIEYNTFFLNDSASEPEVKKPKCQCGNWSVNIRGFHATYCEMKAIEG